VADVLATAERVAVLTGAGMSAESGIPTFRDALTGLWAQYDPTELATPEAFAADPARVFGWYLTRWRMVRDVEPHPGHRALARLQDTVPQLSVITQNVDRLHQRAGVREVIELHGALESFHCGTAGHPFDVTTLDVSPVDGPVEPPQCPHCGAVVRPGVVWFGEMLSAETLTRAAAAVNQADVLLVIGTSAEVYPAAGLPQAARAQGALVVEVNPAQTPVTAFADMAVHMTAGAFLPAVVQCLEEQANE
jgi:NAD-dependent deacetylase